MPDDATRSHADGDGVDAYHRQMAERERSGSEPGFKSYRGKPPHATPDRAAKADKAAREYLAQYADEPGFEKAVADVARWTEKMMQIAARRSAARMTARGCDD